MDGHPETARLRVFLLDDHELVRRGAILGGTVWRDPDLNTEATMKAGKLYIDFDIEPPAPLEHLIFRAHRNGSYYDELVSAVATTTRGRL